MLLTSPWLLPAACAASLGSYRLLYTALPRPSLRGIDRSLVKDADVCDAVHTATRRDRALADGVHPTRQPNAHTQGWCTRGVFAASVRLTSVFSYDFGSSAPAV